MSQNSEKDFGKWRSFFWPIHGYELKKIVPMLGMFFLILFCYTVLRDAKDALIVTKCGHETIPFLKVGGTVPAAILFMIVFSKMSNMLSKKGLFYASLTPFLVFFGLFAVVIYPLRDQLEMTTVANWLEARLPGNWAPLVSMVRNWTYSVFYIMAELWGSVVLSLLFWGFANDITRVSEAKRFYSLFGLGGNLGLVVSGPCIMLATRNPSGLPADQAWGISLMYLMAMVVVAGIAIMAIYGWMHRNVLSDPRFYSPEEVKGKKSKPKMGLGESFKYLLKSKYVLCLALIVICYGICINLVEVTWKGQVKLQYPNPSDYGHFMGAFSTVVGVITIFMMLFVGGNVIRRFGWKAGALFTPVVLLITGAGFFAFIFMKNGMSMGATVFGLEPLLMAVMFGAAQNIFSKASKYSLFDPTKEMAYIPLDQEQKVKGKAAIDVVGARLGKSGGALIQIVLFVSMSAAAALPYIAVILAAMLGVWLLAGRALGTQFNALMAQKDAETATVEAPAAKEVPSTEPVKA